MNVNEMSDEQVNEAIAKLRGDDMGTLHYTDYTGWRWRSCGTKACPLRHVHVAKDYHGDWTHAGPLFDELGMGLATDPRDRSVVALDKDSPWRVVRAATATGAIARAYLAAHQEKP